jgi:DNA repair protein RadC
MGEHDGHRERLLSKLGGRRLCEHEYLEIILYSALPRRNTNDVAHRLIAEFGSLKGVLNASVERLAAVEGIGKRAAQHLYCIGEVMRYYYGEDETNLPKKFTHDHFLSYVKREYEGIYKEVLDVYFIDEDGAVYKRVTFDSKNPFSVSFDSSELTESFVKERTSGIVIVHTHPLGTPQPSSIDDQTTGECQRLCSSHNVVLCDHVIYSSSGIYSYYKSGRLRQVIEKINQRATRVRE